MFTFSSNNNGFEQYIFDQIKWPSRSCDLFAHLNDSTIRTRMSLPLQNNWSIVVTQDGNRWMLKRLLFAYLQIKYNGMARNWNSIKTEAAKWIFHKGSDKSLQVLGFEVENLKEIGIKYVAIEWTILPTDYLACFYAIDSRTCFNTF